jgi:hypothetical protein
MVIDAPEEQVAVSIYRDPALGLGLRLASTDEHPHTIWVADMQEGTPSASHGGIMVGDIMLEVNGQNVVGMHCDEIYPFLSGHGRGGQGTVDFVFVRGKRGAVPGAGDRDGAIKDAQWIGRFAEAVSTAAQRDGLLTSRIGCIREYIRRVSACDLSCMELFADGVTVVLAAGAFKGGLGTLRPPEDQVVSTGIKALRASHITGFEERSGRTLLWCKAEHAHGPLAAAGGAVRVRCAYEADDSGDGFVAEYTFDTLGVVTERRVLSMTAEQPTRMVRSNTVS